MRRLSTWTQPKLNIASQYNKRGHQPHHNGDISLIITQIPSRLVNPRSRVETPPAPGTQATGEDKSVGMSLADSRGRRAGALLVLALGALCAVAALVVLRATPEPTALLGLPAPTVAFR